MEIKVDFSALWAQVDRVSSERVELDWTAATQLDPIDIELLEGRVVHLEDLNVVNGLLSVDGRQVLLYIPDQGKPVDVVQNEPKEGKRFHVAECRTLSDMRSKGRFERYVVTNNLSGVFPISGKDSRGKLKQLDSRLLVCKNCLEKLNYQDYCHDQRKSKIWQDFTIAEFFETYSTSFRYLPRAFTQRALADGYSEDWTRISATIRSRCGFACEDCKVNLVEARHLLHVHHVNGVKQDNSSANLRPLCADCHRKQPLHDHLFISATDMQLLNRLRRTQGIRAHNWEQALKLADLSVKGALTHARYKKLEVPEVGYEFVDAHGAVVGSAELAWSESRVAVYVSSMPPVSGWEVLNPVEFIEKG